MPEPIGASRTRSMAEVHAQKAAQTEAAQKADKATGGSKVSLTRDRAETVVAKKSARSTQSSSSGTALSSTERDRMRAEHLRGGAGSSSTTPAAVKGQMASLKTPVVSDELADVYANDIRKQHGTPGFRDAIVRDYEGDPRRFAQTLVKIRERAPATYVHTMRVLREQLETGATNDKFIDELTGATGDLARQVKVDVATAFNAGVAARGNSDAEKAQLKKLDRSIDRPVSARLDYVYNNHLGELVKHLDDQGESDDPRFDPSFKLLADRYMPAGSDDNSLVKFAISHKGASRVRVKLMDRLLGDLKSQGAKKDENGAILTRRKLGQLLQDPSLTDFTLLKGTDARKELKEILGGIAKQDPRLVYTAVTEHSRALGMSAFSALKNGDRHEAELTFERMGHLVGMAAKAFYPDGTDQAGQLDALLKATTTGFALAAVGVAMGGSGFLAKGAAMTLTGVLTSALGESIEKLNKLENPKEARRVFIEVSEAMLERAFASSVGMDPRNEDGLQGERFHAIGVFHGAAKWGAE